VGISRYVERCAALDGSRHGSEPRQPGVPGVIAAGPLAHFLLRNTGVFLAEERSCNACAIDVVSNRVAYGHASLESMKHGHVGAEARAFLGFLSGIPGLVRRGMSASAADSMLRARLVHRQAALVETIRTSVFGNSRSPYRAMFDPPGWTLADVERAVESQGVENTLFVDGGTCRRRRAWNWRCVLQWRASVPRTGCRRSAPGLICLAPP
jgi:hypothetical protein